MNHEKDLRALIDRDQGLPGEYFTSEAFFEVERKVIFQNNWMCIGLTVDAPTHGDMFAVTLLNFPLLMVRDGAALRVFHNVCSHRGAMLVADGARSGPRIVCPYHGWAYRLNGELAATPHVDGAGLHGAGEFHRSLGLRRVRSAEWAGHVFVNLSGTAPEFADWIKPAAERFTTVEWSELRHDPALTVKCDVAANWKIIC
jgi:choline monooxygenase